MKKDTFFTSPLIYKPIQVVKNQKISLQYDYSITDDNHFINPILEQEFFKHFNIKLRLKNDNPKLFLSDLKSNLESNGDTIVNVDEWNDTEEWQIISVLAIGTFNYKKSVLGKDYDRILEKPNVSTQSILGESIPNQEVIKEPLHLNFSDASQKEAINTAFNNHLVIQGPPGTGKSHTILEVIKQNLLANRKILFVSEKRSALDVVYNKLKKEGLNYLVAYFNSDKNQKKEFYKNLQNTVGYKVANNPNLNPLDFKIGELENYFNSYSYKLTQFNKNLDSSIFDLVSYLAEHQVEDLAYNVATKIPNYKEWFNYLEFLEEMQDIGASSFKIDSLANLPFLYLNKSAFIEKEPLAKIELRLTELEKWVTDIKSTLFHYDINWSWPDLAKYTLAASVLNTANKSQIDILDPKSKNYKSFDTWTKKYEIKLNKLKLSNEICSNWAIKPKLADIDILIDELKLNKSKSWLSFFHKNNVDHFFKHYNGQLSNPLKIEALENLKENYILKSSISELEIKLKHNLHILNPERDINHLLLLRQKLDTLSSNQYIKLLEHEKSLELIESLHQLQPSIQKCNQIIKFLFVDYKIDSISDFKNRIKSIRTYTARFKHLLPEIKKTLNLPAPLINFVRSNDLSVDHLTKIVVYHNYLEQIRFEPTLKKLESIDLFPNFKTLKTLKTERNTQLKSTIYENWTKNRAKTEHLLTTPASKLTAPQKIEKHRQKDAKRVIFHEIAKKQQHLSIKSLVKQTNYSIFDLQPIWIMNPLTIAESLPCDPDFFDVVIFDESSQIPLEDSLPAIYRSKQIVVVGDSKQMPPNQFFSSSTESVTLLNQAESVFKSKLLTWHYRSEHPDLMRFSNSNFYDNELSYFPSATFNKPIELIKIENGIFEEGKNKTEAISVANKYKALIEKNIRNIAIIAFSKEQEKQIEGEILKLNLPKNEELLIRNLENAQGIERDTVLISLGYGFNMEGNFRMNFGPINQEYGGNRLNVLLTRAKQKMLIFTSVHSSDFKLSDNKGVQLLRDFLVFCEGNSTLIYGNPSHFIHKTVNELLAGSDVRFYEAMHGLAINCFIQHSTQKILLVDPSLHSNESKDIYTILSVLDDRFKTVKVLLSHDYWTNKERFEKDVLKYFN